MEAQVTIVGAGPVGALLAYLLSSRGIETVLIERQTDFSREFRGEVLMPSGIRALREAGVSLDDVSTVVPDRFEGYLNRVRFIEVEAAQFDSRPPTVVSQPELLESLVALCEETGAFQLRRGSTLRGFDEWIEAMSQHAEPELAAHLIEHRDEFSRPFLLDTVTDIRLTV